MSLPPSPAEAVVVVAEVMVPAEIAPHHGIPFRRMSFHEAIAFRIYRIRARADQNRPLPGAPVYAHPEEVRHPRRQIEHGDLAGQVEQLQAEEQHDVADDDHD